MKASLLLISIIIGLNIGCQKDPNCGEDVIIDTLELSPATEEGLLLIGTERVVFNDGEGHKIIFKSPAEREYSTKKELLYVICGNDDYRNNQYEVVETENYSIRYTDSLDAQKVMLVHANIKRIDSLLIESLGISIDFGGTNETRVPYNWITRYNIPQRKNYGVSSFFKPENPFSNAIFDTTFNNQIYDGVSRINAGWGTVFYNRDGILQFKQLGDKVWTIESIN